MRKQNSKICTVVQSFGQALLVPVAILPAAGLLYGIGMALKSEQLIAPRSAFFFMG